MRREAIDLTKRGFAAARAMGAPMMTLWLGHDGYDYAFQCNYTELRDAEIAGIAEVCAHDPNCMISIEYKPNELRSYCLLNDASTTLLTIAEVGAANLVVTINVAHSLYADEQPAFAAALIARKSKLLGLHLNDGYSKRDNGLMAASVNELATLELLREVSRAGFDGAIYFVTFPDASRLDPVAECAANIGTVRRLLAAVQSLEGDNHLAIAQSRQDPVAAQEIARLAAARGGADDLNLPSIKTSC